MLESIFLVFFSCEFMQRLGQLICKIEKYWYLEAPPGSRNHLVTRFYFMISKTKSLSFQNYKDIAVKVPLLVNVYFCTPIFPGVFLFCGCCFLWGFFFFVVVFFFCFFFFINCDNSLVKVSVLPLETDFQKHQLYFGIKTCACQLVTH